MPTQTDPTPCLLHSTSVYCNANVYPGTHTSMAFASAAWPAANRAIYIPLALPFSYTCVRAFVVNGAAVAGNFDIGVYSEAFVQLGHTGNFAQAGTNVTQYATLTLSLAAGSYYLGISSSSTGSVIATTGATTVYQEAAGMLQQATANPLPAPMVPAVAATDFWPLFGITRTSSGF